jgi:ABC-2 type transport system permease protein
MQMDIIKLSTDWARAEIFSARVVLLFSVVQIITATGFWYLGRTAAARAFVWPMLLCGLFLIAVGAGLYFANNPRIGQFEKECRREPGVFIEKEIRRTVDSQRQLGLVFKVLPLIIIVAAIMIMLLPMPLWRAIAITVIATTAFLMVVDSNTEARNDAYHIQLLSLKK